MKWLKRTGIALAALLLLLIVVGLLLPRRLHVERQTVIAAPQATVFVMLDNFRTFNRWSPWANLDPKTHYTFTGPYAGEGAGMHWKSRNKNVGKGSETIASVEPGKAINLQLDFDGMGAANAGFLLAPANGGTQVTWTFDTDFRWNLFHRYLGLFMNGRIGRDYEQGLASLKTLAESLPKTDLSGADITLVDTQPQDIVYVSGKTTTDPAAIAKALGNAYGQVNRFIKEQKLKVAGAPMAIARTWDDQKKVYEYDAAIPVDRPAKPAANSTVKTGKAYGGHAARLVYTGAYTGLRNAYDQMNVWLAAMSLTPQGPSWEQYMNDPAKTPAAKLITDIYMPVRYAGEATGKKTSGKKQAKEDKKAKPAGAGKPKHAKKNGGKKPHHKKKKPAAGTGN